MDIQSDTMAERLVQALWDVSLADWRTAALTAAAHPQESRAATALEQALRSADPLRLWRLHDGLETALFRLTTDEASWIVRGWREREYIRTATRQAIEALLCRCDLPPDLLRALTEPLLRLVPAMDDGAGASAHGARIGHARQRTARPP